MAYDIGPRIGIEGEAEFRKAITGINTNLKTLGTEMMAVTSQFDKNEKSSEALTAKNKVLTKQIDEQKNKLGELQKGLESATEKYGENHKVTQGWQQAVNKATADLNNMERELNSNTKAIDDFGNETDDTSEKTSKFSNALTGLGKGLANVGKVTAQAAVAGIKAVGTATVAAAAGALKLAVDVGKTADDLMTLSNQTGISTQQLQEWDYAMRFIDVDMGTMTKSMARLVKSMDTASKGGKDITEAFDKLGVSWKDNEGNMRNNQEVFNDLIGALGKVENETERDALAMRLFGKSAQELNPLIQAGSEELARLSEEAHKVGAVLSDEALEAAGKFDDTMQTLEASTKGLVGTLGVTVIPAVSEVVNTIVAIVPQITEALKTGDWESAGQAVSDGLNGLLEKITNNLPGLATMASTIIGGIAGSLVVAIPEVLPPLIDATLMLFNTLIKILTDNGPMLIESGIDALMMLIEGLIKALPSLRDAALEIMLTLRDNVIDLLPQLIPAAIQVVLTLTLGIIDALPKLIERLPEIIQTIVDTLVANLPLLVDAAIAIVVALATAIITNLPMILESTLKIITTIAKGLWEGMPKILEFIPQLFSKLLELVKNTDWLELGKNIVVGLWNGIKDYSDWLREKVLGFVKGIGNVIKDFFGIESPSKLMIEYGRYIDEGLAKGIEDNAGKPKDAANSLAETIDSALQKVNNFVTGTVNIIKKEFELWRIENEMLRGSSAELEMQLKTQEQQHALLTEQIQVTQIALTDIIAKYGEGSSEALKYKSELLDLQIAQKNLANEIDATTKSLNEQHQLQIRMTDKGITVGNVLYGKDSNARYRELKDKNMSENRSDIEDIARRNNVDMSTAYDMWEQNERDKLLKKVPRYAQGTSFHPGGPAIINELGPELVELPRGSKVYSHQQSKEMLKQGDTIIHVHNPQPSPSELARQIKKTQRELALGF